MTPIWWSLEGVRCHCGGDEDGHPPIESCLPPDPGRAPVIEAEAGSVCIGGIFGYPRVRYSLLKPRGTCRVCGKRNLVVKRVRWIGRTRIVVSAYLKARGVTGDGEWSERGPQLQIAPEIAPHRAAGVDCTGAGSPPRETRYMPSRYVQDWAREHGEESILRTTKID